MALYGGHHDALSRHSYSKDIVAESSLPNGSCNFRDLSIGARAPSCGCKRFWLNGDHHGGQSGGSWCFCGHHACFHHAWGDLRGSFHASAAEVSRVATAPVVESNKVTRNPPSGLGILPSPAAATQSIDTRLWNALNDFARHQEDGTASTHASDLPSTAPFSVAGEGRASPSRALQQAALRQSMAPPIAIPRAEPQFQPPPEELSATEVATPSLNGTPDLRVFGPPATRTSPSGLEGVRQEIGGHARTPSRLGGDSRGLSPGPTNVQAVAVSASSSTPVQTVQELHTALRILRQRVEALENLSFSQMPAEDVYEHFDIHDARLLDLERWRDDHEHERDSSPQVAHSSKRRRLRLPDDDSPGSDGSFDSTAAAHTEAAVLATIAVNAETGPRIDALESRVASLEHAALPSYDRPWQVQVVLLPWGRDLRGIWFSAGDATQQSLKCSTQASEEWTGAEAAPKRTLKAGESGTWTTESIQAWAEDAHEWLSPKACGPNGTVFKRLASRGFVQEVELTAPDSKHILDTISAAFRNDLLGLDSDAPSQTQYQGLREPIVPLRKVRKSSRLRFLTPAEMVTSASWTAGFLDSGVLMRMSLGERRLYVTTPDAYLQLSTEGWSWPKLRALPVQNACVDEEAARASETIIEACWTYKQSLDYVSSVASSFAPSHDSAWSTRSQHSELRKAVVKGSTMAQPSEVGHHRTLSLPSSVSGPGAERATLSERRVASFNAIGSAYAKMYRHVEGLSKSSAEEMVSPSAATFTMNKRRRISISPEAERRGVGFTPRMSRGPPSPGISDHAGEVQSMTGASRKRGTTPFAYATPHSNSTHAGRMEYDGDGGDTEVDTVLEGHSAEHVDEEWHGVGTGMDVCSVGEKDGDDLEEL